MKEVLELISIIGLPGVQHSKLKPKSLAPKLFELARKNKIPLLLLKNVDVLQKERRIYGRRYQYFLNMLQLLATTFSRSDLHYSLIKTIKPFAYIPSDIDVLVGTKQDLQKAVSMLREEGLDVVEQEKNEITLFSEEYHLNVDLYLDLNVIDFIYLNKEQLFKHTYLKKIQNSNIRTLQPPAELVVVASHALYKEQMFTLSDFYTFMRYRKYIMTGRKIAIKTTTKIAYNSMLHFVYEILKYFNTNRQKRKGGQINHRLPPTQLKLPHKFSFDTLVRAFWEKLVDRYAFVSVLDGMKNLLTPKFYKNIISHTVRETY